MTAEEYKSAVNKLKQGVYGIMVSRTKVEEAIKTLESFDFIEFADQEKKKEAIEFAEWMSLDGWIYKPHLDKCVNIHTIDKVTTDELYTIFKNKDK